MYLGHDNMELFSLYLSFLKMHHLKTVYGHVNQMKVDKNKQN